MVLTLNTIQWVVMLLVLVFASIHVGVGAGIIAENRGFRNFFRPEIGLASYNIVISALGFVTAFLGLAMLSISGKAKTLREYTIILLIGK